MKDKIEVIFTNNLDISVLDKDFYLSLLSVITNFKEKEKEMKNEPQQN